MPPPIATRSLFQTLLRSSVTANRGTMPWTSSQLRNLVMLCRFLFSFSVTVLSFHFSSYICMGRLFPAIRARALDRAFPFSIVELAPFARRRVGDAIWKPDVRLVLNPNCGPRVQSEFWATRSTQIVHTHILTRVSVRSSGTISF